MPTLIVPLTLAPPRGLTSDDEKNATLKMNNMVARHLIDSYMESERSSSVGLITVGKQIEELLKNCIDAGASRATLSIDTTEDGNIIFTLSNAGTFPAEMVSSNGGKRDYLDLLEGSAFYTTGKSSGALGGSGMGLAQTAKILAKFPDDGAKLEIANIKGEAAVILTSKAHPISERKSLEASVEKAYADTLDDYAAAVMPTDPDALEALVANFRAATIAAAVDESHSSTLSAQIFSGIGPFSAAAGVGRKPAACRASASAHDEAEVTVPR